MITLDAFTKDEIVYCPSLELFFICKTEEQRELVKKYNERVKEK